MNKKLIIFTFLIAILGLGLLLVFIPSEVPLQTAEIKPAKLNELKITKVGKSVSEGVTSDKYAFKTRGNNVIELGIQNKTPTPSAQSILNSLIKTVEASDEESPRPYFKADKWDGEANLSLLFKDEGGFDMKLDNNGEAISENSNYKFEFKPVDIKQGFNDEGGLDMFITIKNKPSSNKLTFTYDNQNVSAYLQPSLTKEWTIGQDLGNGATVASVTDTDVYDNQGNLVAHRPDYVVNGIAFYAADGKSGDYSALGGKNYKTGEIGMLYRLKATDSQGKSAWFDWSLSGSSIVLNDTTNFLQTASYPVTLQPAGDTFGYTTAGGTAYNAGSAGMGYSYLVFSSPGYVGASATGASMSVYQKDGYDAVPGAYEQVYQGLYTLSGSTYSLIANGATIHSTDTSSASWLTQNFITPPTLSATTYYLCQLSTYNVGGIVVYYNNVGGYTGARTGGMFPPMPSSFATSGTWGTNAQMSIYVAYSLPPTINFNGLKMQGVKIN
jgi:hypothetical protein